MPLSNTRNTELFNKYTLRFTYSSHYLAKSHSLIMSCILRPHPSHHMISLSNMRNMQIKKTGNARETNMS